MFATVLRAASALALVFGLGAAPAWAGPTLDKIKQAGSVVCGVNTGLAGFGQPDSQGRYSGLDIDICKAIAAAMFGDPEKVRYVPLTAQQRFTALQSGEVDILSRNTTATLQRDAELGLNFAPVVFYDGQGFMVPKKLNVDSARKLDGATVCVQPGTTTELNLADYFRANSMQFQPLVIEKLDEVVSAYLSGRCDVITTDRSGLAAVRTGRTPNPDEHAILPETISKEPLAPAVRQGDDQWADIVRWVVYALIEAEEKGITSQNIDEKLKSEDPEIRRLLGTTPGMGKALGLDEKWAYNAVKSVGNYGQIFERNVGAASPLKLERGINDLWKRGGLIYAMPVR
ncbi:MAG: amino acid ABC transporter substrate-binding protein [Alphaproteobacteria bacterium]